jgi:hypothetical protein
LRTLLFAIFAAALFDGGYRLYIGHWPDTFLVIAVFVTVVVVGARHWFSDNYPNHIHDARKQK